MFEPLISGSAELSQVPLSLLPRRHALFEDGLTDESSTSHTVQFLQLCEDNTPCAQTESVLRGVALCATLATVPHALRGTVPCLRRVVARARVTRLGMADRCFYRRGRTRIHSKHVAYTGLYTVSLQKRLRCRFFVGLQMQKAIRKMRKSILPSPTPTKSLAKRGVVTNQMVPSNRKRRRRIPPRYLCDI